jgi:ABC-type nitrate/sulfonate/bicarbonate transport system substrate-binding protein
MSPYWGGIFLNGCEYGIFFGGKTAYRSILRMLRKQGMDRVRVVGLVACKHMDKESAIGDLIG